MTHRQRSRQFAVRYVVDRIGGIVRGRGEDDDDGRVASSFLLINHTALFREREKMARKGLIPAKYK